VAKTQQTETVFRNSAVLIVAGSDCSGGAGIQLDLRALFSLGVHGLSAISAVTAQSNHRVRAIHAIPARQLAAQLDAAMDDVDIAAVKIGMLGSVANIRAVARFLRRHALKSVVLDPVLASTSGTALLSRAGLTSLKDDLLPLADVLTPNVPEAARLLGSRVSGALAADRLLRLGARSVLLKGGHGSGDDVVDYFVDGTRQFEFRHRRLPFDARGTGCALSTAIAAGLASGKSRLQAVRDAERFLQRALRKSEPLAASGKHLLLLDPIDK
jgi:hydroxymethylpyrimidine/phosphomethylpyrimidine kinase